MIDFQGSWDEHLPLIEFAYNNSYHASIEMAPFEALYGRKCRSPIGWFEVGEIALIGPDLVFDAMEKVRLIRERLKSTQSLQKCNDPEKFRLPKTPLASLFYRGRMVISAFLYLPELVWRIRDHIFD